MSETPYSEQDKIAMLCDIGRMTEESRSKLAKRVQDLETALAAKEAELAKANAALLELWQWCDGWSPAFFDDPEWSDAEDRIKPAVNAARKSKKEKQS